jgi:hypothetical protein
VRKPQGLATNGGCDCIRDAIKSKRGYLALREYAPAVPRLLATIAARDAEIERLRHALSSKAGQALAMEAQIDATGEALGVAALEDAEGYHHVAIEKLRARCAAMERVVEAARAWVRFQEEQRHGQYLDGVPGDLMDALDATPTTEEP